jgi:2-phosphoglycerate kinase
LSTQRHDAKGKKMTYTDPFSHGAVESTIEAIIDDADATYTIVTEAEDYLGNQDDIDMRYDTIQCLAGNAAQRYANSLASDGRDVAIFHGRQTSPKIISQRIPVGYVYPDGVWRKVSQR